MSTSKLKFDLEIRFFFMGIQKTASQITFVYPKNSHSFRFFPILTMKKHVCDKDHSIHFYTRLNFPIQRKFYLNWLMVTRAATRLKFWKTAIFAKNRGFSLIKWKPLILKTWFLSHSLGNFVDLNVYLNYFFDKTLIFIDIQ